MIDSDFRGSKPWYTSWRTWFNLLMGISAVAAQQGIIPPSVVAAVTPIGNIILNQITDGARITLTR